jgi:aspartate aminotransferase
MMEQDSKTVDKTILSDLAETLIGSVIVKMNSDIRDLMSKGEKIYNLTIGDFDPSIFPIPHDLEEEIVYAYRKHLTNYPLGEGELDLRKAIGKFIHDRQGLSYKPDEILITSGGRPVIYTVFRAVVDKGDKVIYPVPSWNNNHYVHFVQGEHCPIVTTAETNFMPTAEMIEPHVKGATLISLNSPLNPTGTTFSEEQLRGICELVINENKRRQGGKKLYIMYDQIYWMLTYGDTVHHDPVSLYPELKDYTIYVDGISKCFAATGVRVGWAMGPSIVISKMKAILSHIGAWAPMPEQKATAKYLMQKGTIDQFMKVFRSEILERCNKIYEGFMRLRNEGFAVNAITPQAAIYLSVQFDLKGRTTMDGKLLADQTDVTAYLLNEAKIGLVPFQVFGADSSWYRLSVGNCKKEEINEMLVRLKQALKKLS